MFSLQIWHVFEARWCREILIEPRWDAAIVALAAPSNEEYHGSVEHPGDLTAESLWQDVSARLRGALNDTTFRNWFGEATAVSVDDDAFVLGVPNDFTREWIESHFLELIRAAVKDVTGGERRVRLTVEPGLDPAAGAGPSAPGPADTPTAPRSGWRWAASTRSTPSTPS